MFLGIDKGWTISIQGNDRDMVKKIIIDENTSNMLLRDWKWEENRKRMQEFLFTNLDQNVLQDWDNSNEKKLIWNSNWNWWSIW